VGGKGGRLTRVVDEAAGQREFEAAIDFVKSVDGTAGGRVRGLLAPREVEVLRLMAAGLANAEIAAALVISPETVKTYVSRIFTKLGLRDRIQAVILAFRTGLADTDH